MCRLDIEAAAAYAFPPVTGVALLMLEHNNSYIRFHAWQVIPNENVSLMVVCHVIQWTHCTGYFVVTLMLDPTHHNLILIGSLMDAIHC